MLRDRLKQMFEYFCEDKMGAEAVDMAFDHPEQFVLRILPETKDALKGALIGIAMVQTATNDEWWMYFLREIQKEKNETNKPESAPKTH